MSHAHSFVGFQIEVNDDGSIYLNQAAYVRKLLQKFNMENCKKGSVPMQPNLEL